MSTSGTLRSGWQVLRTSPDRVLVPVIAVSVPAIALHVLLQHLVGVWIAGSQDCARTYLGMQLHAECGPSNGRAQLALLVGLLTFLVLGQLVATGLYRACLDAVDEAPVRGPFTGWRPGTAVPTALLLGVLLTVGTLLCVLPGLVLGFFTRYTMLFALEGLSPLAAIGASFRLVGSRFGAELGFTLRAAGLLLLGVLVLGIGLYVAVPVVLIAQAQRYRAAGLPGTVGVQPEDRAGTQV